MPDGLRDMTGELGRPIRVIVFGGPYLHPAAVEFVARVEAHHEIELLAVLCEGPGIGVKPRLANLWGRRRLMAIPVVAAELSSTLYRWLCHPAAARMQRRHARGALEKAVSVPDIHAERVLDRVRAWSPDLGLVYGAPILKPALFGIPTFGTLGIHHGRVPDYRGKKTTFWEMYHGEAVAGVTIQRINPGIDTGDIAKTGAVPIGRKGYWRVERETEALGFDLFIETILDVVPRVHGFIYIGYLITVIDLATRMRWSWGRGIVIALAGTVPFLSFVAEHKVTRQTRAQLAAA